MPKPESSARRPEGLAFGLRENVDFHDRGGKLHLVLRYPLKAVELHPWWREIIECLAKGAFMPFDQLQGLKGDTSPAKIERFLNTLVRRGFLAQLGVSLLETLPRVSVIIPVRNRPLEIEACLDSLLKLDYPHEKLEIIVVDDASTDRTPNVVARFPVRLIKIAQNRKAPYCRNLAAQKASGEILAFIDSDCLAHPRWLRDLLPGFKEREVGAIGGKVGAYYDDNGLDRYEKVKSSLDMGAWVKRSERNHPFFYVPSCNLLVRRDLFLRLGGFNEALVVGEDVDLCWRLRNQGHHIEFQPLGTVYHKHRNRPTAFCRRRFEYGTSEPRLQKMHPDKIKTMVFPPPKLAFWTVVIAALMTGFFQFLALGAMVMLVDGLWTCRRVKTLPIGPLTVFKSVGRGYLAFFYHCCAFVSRYYLICTPLLALLSPWLALMPIGMHAVATTVDLRIKKPRLHPLLFAFYYTLEQLAYQAGVWWGCFRYGCFRPVNPRIVWRVPA